MLICYDLNFKLKMFYFRYTYYFGHGNLKYYEVNDDFYEAVLPTYADKLV